MIKPKVFSWWNISKEFEENTDRWGNFSVEEYEDLKIREQTEFGIEVFYTGVDGKEVRYPAVNHYPEQQMYEIWQLVDNTPEKMGEIEARNFAQAVNLFNAIQVIQKARYINSLQSDADPTMDDIVSSPELHYASWSEKIARAVLLY